MCICKYRESDKYFICTEKALYKHWSDFISAVLSVPYFVFLKYELACLFKQIMFNITASFSVYKMCQMKSIFPTDIL